MHILKIVLSGIGKNIYYILITFKLTKSEAIVIINVPAEFKDHACACGLTVVTGRVSVSGKVVGTTHGSSSGPGFSGQPMAYFLEHLCFLSHKYKGQKYSFMGLTSIVLLSVSLSKASGQGLLFPSCSISL